MPADRAQASPARPHLGRARAIAARGVVVFALGAIAAMLAAGLGWMLLEPPLPRSGPFVRLPLVVTLFAYAAPLVLMAIGTGLSWADNRGPRLLFLVLTLLATMLFGTTLVHATLDLFGGRYATPAVVLGRYDCDRLDATGRTELALSCVELAWTLPDGRASRDRFVIADEALPDDAEDSITRGRCVRAWLWPRSERLIGLRSVDSARCSDPDRVRRGLMPPP